MTSDATPGTPVDPRHDEHVATVIRNAIDQWRIQNDPADLHGVSLHEYIRVALAEAGLLALPDEGSLRSQASGGPADLVAEALRGYRLDLDPNTAESIRRGMTRLDLSGGERRDIGLIAAKALGLEGGR